MKDRRKLGSVQAQVLGSLKVHGKWSRGCGWVWGSERETQRHMDRLVETGWAIRATEGWRQIYYPS